MGKVDDSVKVDLMTRAHILLFTAVREGWGLIITEANARGTPVIAYDVPGVRDVVVSGQNGLLVEPDNVQEMARLSCVLLEDHARRMRLTKSAIDFAR
jgi:glycosyltransferase involved in cell wall biosynthesis